jgi:ligand-binding SRPBCC domain-containing protein
MDTITETVTINAPLVRCFALSTRIELVQRTLGMKLIPSDRPGSLTSGHIVANSRVHWHGWKFGLPTSHHTLITRFEPPHTHYIRTDGHAVTQEAFFQDTQERGRFAAFHHDHYFLEEIDIQADYAQPFTILRDEVFFALPFGLLGRLAAKHLLAPHIRKLARQRFAIIKSLAEGDGWREWVADDASTSAS